MSQTQQSPSGKARILLVEQQVPMDRRALQLPHTSHGTSPSWTHLAKGASSKHELPSFSYQYLCKLIAAFGPASQLPPASGKRRRAVMNGTACASGPDPYQPGSELAVPFGCSNQGVLAAARAGSVGQRWVRSLPSLHANQTCSGWGAGRALLGRRRAVGTTTSPSAGVHPGALVLTVQ